MDLNYLKKVIKIFDDSNMAEITIEEEGTKIKLAKNRENKNQPIILPAQNFVPNNNFVETHSNAPVLPNSPNIEQGAGTNLSPKEQDASQQDSKTILHTVYSPIVGTFYRSPSPESDPYVEIGSHVTAGTTLCIIEAMKLMNEIECDASGTIVKILIENTQPVEFNQPLFIIKPD
ncbi:MAG: acetyl-CoA carboxylase, biotin carboxyl carrier protein [Ignavibacteria bacterium GWB2_35_12]|nr:MAG: acetyl-CoA carboxylase, biotin carboxyl carrier protein [Ignavibacteria bacterium GWA2_35_8]OGU40192.1 MAG: acetyl-CoA carboxylase, biotin carboxyl carrier protein [Ignavibacteria bacterium GWB2_35_12]OGU92386.1 MAG: acetyl-CoA carboxylase, biotin carboxyl carrier protein [Ignavibacteria bacterium RIFOXYA2_FULL_35_10]OGV22347.1 MAG: acetyl-CoA carboxylase, biotin carboxyl carrier protein [Ignavibacteria bacterium RIFOXYC2_FULL_35_21]